MKLSIIIPAFNEEKTLGAIVEKVQKLNLASSEIIVVDDGSTDETGKIVKKLSGKNVTTLSHSKNEGKGKAIVDALKIVRGEIVLIQDADLEYDPSEIPKLLAPFSDKKVQVVYGSRKMQKNAISNQAFNLGGQLLTFFTNTIYGSNITDEATGYKLFRANVIKHMKLNAKGFEFCPEVTAKVLKQKIDIVEIPISYNPRPISEKKIKWWDGLWAIFYLIKYRFVD